MANVGRSTTINNKDQTRSMGVQRTSAPYLGPSSDRFKDPFADDTSDSEVDDVIVKRVSNGSEASNNLSKGSSTSRGSSTFREKIASGRRFAFKTNNPESPAHKI